MNPNFVRTFKSDNHERDSFLSRMFGIISEEIVRIWCRCVQSPYEDLGRPTLVQKGYDGKFRATLDFTFKSKQDGKIFVGEMKSELEYENYKYLTLTSTDQFKHHIIKLAFIQFLEIAKNPEKFTVTIQDTKNKRKSIAVSGSILVWGKVSDEGKKNVMEETKLADVLSLEQIINDLLAWNNSDYIDFIKQRFEWSEQIFSSLLRREGH